MSQVMVIASPGHVVCSVVATRRHVEIRMKIVHELIVHSDVYLSDEFLSAGSSIAKLSLKYAQYSMFYAAGRKLTSSDIRDQYEQEVMEVSR